MQTGHEVYVSASGKTYPIVDIVDKSGKILSSGEWAKATKHVRGEEIIYARVYGYGGNSGAY